MPRHIGALVAALKKKSLNQSMISAPSMCSTRSRVGTNDNVMDLARKQVQFDESLATAARRGLYLKGIIPVL